MLPRDQDQLQALTFRVRLVDRQLVVFFVPEEVFVNLDLYPVLAIKFIIENLRISQGVNLF